jgi:hypothetical protein
MLSFVQLLILRGGKESPQFEATFLIAAKPAKHRIATGHFRIEANMAKVIRHQRCGSRFRFRFLCCGSLADRGEGRYSLCSRQKYIPPLKDPL